MLLWRVAAALQGRGWLVVHVVLSSVVSAECAHIASALQDDQSGVVVVDSAAEVLVASSMLSQHRRVILIGTVIPFGMTGLRLLVDPFLQSTREIHEVISKFAMALPLQQ